MLGNKQRAKLGRVLGERLEALACGGSRRRGVLTGAAAMAGQRRSVCEGRRTGGLFIGDGVYSYQTSYGFASGQIPRRSQGTLLPSSGEPKVSNPWNNVQRKDSI
jgi:hypothetical protein